MTSPLATQRFNGAPEIDSVPQDDRRHDQVKPAGPVLLSFTGPVADPAEAMEANGAGERVARLALVQFRRGLAAQRWILQPVEREQGPLDPSDLAKRQGEAVLAWIGTQPPQHQRRRHGPSSDRCRQPEDVIPMSPDQHLVDSARDERLQRWPSGGGAKRIKPTVMEIGNARREAKAQEVAERKHVVGNSATVGVVDGGRKTPIAPTGASRV